MRPNLASLFVAGLLFPLLVSASDWPQFLGPNRNGVYGGNDIAESWASNGLPLLWQSPIGHGFSGPVVVEHKLVLFHRLGDQEKVSCLDASTGSEIWTFAYPTTYQDDFGFDDGPRATPAIAEGRVYTLGAQGMLHCLEFATGKKLWSEDLQTKFQPRKGFFGIACSPMVEGDAVLLNIGGVKGAGIVALNKKDGRLLWKATDDDASYSSPVAASIGGKRYALFLTRAGLVGLDPLGNLQFHISWHSRNRMSVNAASPVVVGDTIFLSACYGTGAVLLRPHGHDLETVWSNDELLSNHYATSVEFNGLLFGIHGRTDPGFNPHPRLRCLDPKTQKVCWETDSLGAASLIRASNKLLVLTEKGELVLADASAEGFRPRARAQVLSPEVRAFPALADGFLYARNKEQLVCVDLRKQNEK
jgi:outer membrane protein assembly factor BamB